MGTSVNHSDPDHRISFNRSVRCFTGKAFGKSPEIHGFGIPNIISIAENADGFCSFDIENNQFVAIVTLPYPIKKEL